MELCLCILAAGQGKRMNSDLPKVLHPIGGQPMIGHVLAAAAQLTTSRPVIIHGHGGARLQDFYAGHDLTWVIQEPQLGTGHAMLQALPVLSSGSLVLILYGDVPLLSAPTLKRLVEAAEPQGFSLLTVILDDPTGCGRIVRDEHGRIVRIVEHKDASPDELHLTEVNTGVMAVRAEYLQRWLPALRSENAQGEYYLTDCVAMAVAEGIPVIGVTPDSAMEVTGVNDRRQQALLERAFQAMQAEELMRGGVSLRDPARLDIRGELVCGRDVCLDVNVVFEGKVRLGDGVRVGPNCLIRDSVLEAGVEVLANTVIEQATIGSHSKVGPFARIRPETILGTDVHIGNFVEVKKSVIAEGSKVNHLSYVGDAEIGRAVNVGAGTITCNYDGAHKHRTVIEDDAFIGSDTQLVAPVRVGKGATVAAGTTVTEDVEPGRLVISRVRQKTIAGYQRPRKDK
ncbi:MAG: UDP-N-acetylglucosamine diphosphorylase/glucosamine-1-phosphate N-acetyltransferase [Gammaproteobacteria bacterium]|nr:UDP-N-acetylglucosamine diphosphorylase/glucosamine-1-phosphate N-acetyltransferase [Gammaproteobacteria bacterium]